MLYINLYSIKNKLNIKGKEMLYIPKIGDIVKVNRMVGDDPKLLQNFIKGGKLDQEEVDRITFQNPIEF